MSKHIKLSDIATVIVGYPFKSENFNTEAEGIRLVRGMNVSEKKLRFDSESRWWNEFDETLQPYMLKSNDILIGMDGSKVGRNFAIVGDNDLPLLLVQRVACIRAKNPDLQKYIWACINDGRFTDYVNSIKTGSSIPHISKTQIEDFKIPLMDEISAINIGNWLSNVDSNISTNNFAIQTLESLAKTIYDYWFLQFEFPNEEGKPYKSSGGKMVWNEELKREIPEGWEVKKLADIEKDIVTGKTPTTKDSTNFGVDVPFVTIEDIRNNVFIIDTNRKLSTKGAETQRKKYIEKGSLCVSCIASVGEVGFVSQKSQTNQQINSIIFKNENNKEYLYFAIKSYFQNSRSKVGNIFDNVNKEEFSSINFLYDSNIINLFHVKTMLLFNQILNCTNQNQQLTELRDFLLPMFMNGQVIFKDI